MPDDFWVNHYTYAEAARKLGCTRQNVYQQALKGRIPLDRDKDGHPGIPIDYVDEVLALREKDVDEYT